MNVHLITNRILHYHQIPSQKAPKFFFFSNGQHKFSGLNWRLWKKNTFNSISCTQIQRIITNNKYKQTPIFNKIYKIYIILNDVLNLNFNKTRNQVKQRQEKNKHCEILDSFNQIDVLSILNIKILSPNAYKSINTKLQYTRIKWIKRWQLIYWILDVDAVFIFSV